MSTVRTLDPRQERKIEKRRNKFDKKPNSKRRRKSEQPPDFNPKDWK